MGWVAWRVELVRKRNMLKLVSMELINSFCNLIDTSFCYIAFIPWHRDEAASAKRFLVTRIKIVTIVLDAALNDRQLNLEHSIA